MTYRYRHTNGRKSKLALVIPSSVDLMAGNATKKTSSRLFVGWNCLSCSACNVTGGRLVMTGRRKGVNANDGRTKGLVSA
jgi:hypothetical protein